MPRKIMLALMSIAAVVAVVAPAQAHAPDSAVARRTLPTYLRIWASPRTVHKGETSAVSTALRDTAGNVPVPGEPVKLWYSTDGGHTWNDDGITVVTDNDGQATAIVHPQTTTTYEWRFAGDQTRAGAISPTAEVEVTRWPTTLTMYDTHTTIYPGDETRLVAGLTRTDDGAPAFGQTVDLWGSTDGGSTWTLAGSAATDSTGTAWVDVSPAATTTYEWRYAGDADLAASTSPPITITVVIAQPTSLDIDATPDRVVPGGTSVIDGYLRSGGSPVGGNRPVRLFASTDGGGTWTAVGIDGTDVTGHVWWEVTPRVPTTYQWRYEGSRDFLPTSSPTQLVSISPTATDIFIQVNPGRITPGGTATISGWLHSDLTTGIAGRVLNLNASTDGGATWTSLGTETTDASGAVSRDVSPTVPTMYQWTFAGDATYDPSYSRNRTLEVGPPPTLTAHVSRDRLASGQLLKVWGTYSDPVFGRGVRLLRFTDKVGWRLIELGHMDADGHYRFRIRPDQRGVWKLRTEVYDPITTRSPVCRVRVD